MARDRDMVEEAREEEHEADTMGARDKPEEKGERKRGGAMMKKHKRARGGHLDAAKEHKVHMGHHHARKHGGKVHGEEAKHRMDRRARGGGTSDMSPLTSAGKMSMPDYENKSARPEGGGMGPDKSPYGGGHHRRPG